GGVELTERLQQLGECAGFAEILGLGVLQRGRIGTGGEFSNRGVDDGLKLLHGGVNDSHRIRIVRNKKREALSPPSLLFSGQAREALACSAILLNAALS